MSEEKERERERVIGRGGGRIAGKIGPRDVHRTASQRIVKSRGWCRVQPRAESNRTESPRTVPCHAAPHRASLGYRSSCVRRNVANSLLRSRPAAASIGRLCSSACSPVCLLACLSVCPSATSFIRTSSDHPSVRLYGKNSVALAFFPCLA